ncbi:hypothetical protein P3T76_005764 [Phytophthora citrophthora]|uniref:Crinkler effector protein N-terminal domain-containing protein n=1 Tax=Phytophthora citrophthora TaxID=4793 RepID=A0AAD9GQU3_9STRA|nr:hypothetical protein P3T76_005764 [Phytophthora citrophthora]
MKPFCAIVDEAGSPFDLDIDDTEPVSTLKKAIKAKNQNKLKGVDAVDMKLFLAKRKQKKVEAKEKKEENGEEKWRGEMAD